MSGQHADTLLQRLEQAHPRFVDLQFIDIQGMVKSVTLSINRFKQGLGVSEWFDGSAIEGLSRVSETDTYLRPDETTVAVVPSTDEGERMARVLCDVYTPKGERPAVSDLTDRTKAEQLCAEIQQAALPDDVKTFLLQAAQRHVVYNFRNIAEFYCHAPADVQHLMERSGLIIIDFDKAIQNGFVHMTERLGKIADIEKEARGDGNA